MVRKILPVSVCILALTPGFAACSKYSSESDDGPRDTVETISPDTVADTGVDLISPDTGDDVSDAGRDSGQDFGSDPGDTEETFPDIPPIECSSNLACERAWQDLPVCWRAFCDPWLKICIVAPMIDGTVCDTEDRCLTDGRCMAGACVGTSLNCDDGNPCTDDSCDSDAGCRHTANSAACSDGNNCTENDKCINGVCRAGTNTCSCGSDPDCADHEDNDLCNGRLKCIGQRCVIDQTTVVNCEASTDFCIASTCNPATGLCGLVPANQGSACDDADECSVNDVCREGVCAGDKSSCDDHNPCTDDGCSVAEGCTHVPNNGTCDDGNACTLGDRCIGGMCMGSRNPECGCLGDGDCAGFEDGNRCNGTLVCRNSQCVVNPATIIRCADPIGKPCQRSVCDPAVGRCRAVKLEDGRPCVDDNSCTFDEVCNDGECVGYEVPCNDGNLCTDDFCDRYGGCNHSYNNVECEDGDPCTIEDKCQNGSCVGGGARECDDGKPCTVDRCSSSTGCYAEPIVEQGVACESTDPCIINATCENGLCVGTRKNCEDGDPCTDNYCDSVDGVCKKRFNAAPCEDGNECTTGDYCNLGSCVAGRSRDCSDTDPCTADLCVVGVGCTHDQITGCLHCPSGLDSECVSPYPCKLGRCDMSSDPLGRCVWFTDPCEDNNPCTKGTCNEWTGLCRYEPVYGSCDDGNPCTLNDQCNSTTMLCVGTPLVCNDGDVCTDDFCDRTDGKCKTSFNNAPCVDDDPCTLEDQCSEGICTGGTPKDCEDLDPCTDNFCDPITGMCRQTLNSESCEDGDPCTVGDYCSLGECLTGSPKNCSDNNECTVDSCRASDGVCLHAPNPGITCGASNKCILSGVCGTDGNCSAIYKNCDDTKVCTTDSCNPSSGLCVHTPNTLGCDDGNACTGNDVCFNGLCSGADIICNDGLDCTSDWCNPQTGCVFSPIDTACDDQNPCTEDKCVVGRGCVHTAVDNAAALSCSDGNPCSLDDVCIDGTCTGTPKNCNDGIICTNDSCNTVTGDCVNAYFTGPCDDNNPCTDNDACSGGICTGPAKVCNDNLVCTVDYCNQETGCVFSPNNVACDDGNKCTVDTCVPGTGCVHTPVTTAISCDDGNPCTNGDACNTTTGACTGILDTCTDNNDCTIDTCVTATGACVHSPKTGTCNDGVDCTINDTCISGVCYGTPTDSRCNDNNACTTDTCSLQQKSCVYSVSGETYCDDFDPCTMNDMCDGTECFGGLLDCPNVLCLNDPRCS